MEFRLLGDIEVLADGRQVAVGYAQLRITLAVLLMEANRPVPVDQLVDRVWGNHSLPLRPRSAVQHNMTLLRRTLAETGNVTITLHPAGYQLSIDAERVDVHRFRSLLKQACAAGDDDRRLPLLEQALRLWRGEPFTGLDTPWLSSLRTALDNERYSAQLDLTDIQLHRGQHASLLPSLSGQVERYPLDERLAGQYLLALYRGGRQADALEHYDQLRHRLAEELGADPSPPLRELHVRILTADVALAAPASPVVSSASLPSAAPGPPVPRQLPAPPPLFTGRARELAYLTEAASEHPESGGTMVISAIGGVGGIGKTWLALQWAYQHLDLFPDGQLYANLRGFDPSGRPMPSTSAIRGFLVALAADPAAIPVGLEAQAALYRSLVVGKRMLIVLDNARDTSQIVPLLPGTPACTVLVTSRSHLGGLVTGHGARSLDLDVLSRDDARHLLTTHLGCERASAEPDAVTSLLASCAGLPLAISIVAARATRRPNFPLGALATELRDSGLRLDALHIGDARADLRAVLSWSCHALSPEAASAFGLLGLTPGPDIALPAAASLLGLPLTTTRTLLRNLEDAYLVLEHVPGRYRMHDLVRLYAATEVDRGHTAASQETALRRLADFYLHTANAGHRHLNPQAESRDLDPPAPGCHPHPLADAPAALDWFEAEHSCLLATQRMAARQGWHPTAWHLAWTLEIFHLRRGHREDAVAVWRIGLASAGHLLNPAADIVAHRFLGRALSRMGLDDEAAEHLQRALALAEQARDRLQRAHTHRTLAVACIRQGEGRQALEHSASALRLFRDLGNPVWEADALNAMGSCAMRIGEYDQAHEYCQAALAMHRRLGNRLGESSTLDSLGEIAYHTGEYAQALSHFRQSLPLFRALGYTYEIANSLDAQGLSYAALGQAEQARAVWLEALGLYRAQGRHNDAARVRRRLSSLDSSEN